MKISSALLAVSPLFLASTDAFLAPTTPSRRQHHATLQMSSQQPGDSNEFYKMAADQMKNLKPEDLDQMVAEMDNMNPIQKTALKAMGMDPEVMKKSMEMMRKNPAMIESAQRMMANMTPEQLMEQSKQAQEKMSKMSASDIDQASKVMETLPKEALNEAAQQMEKIVAAAAATAIPAVNGVVDSSAKEDDDDDEEKEMYTGPGSSSDSAVVDAMYRVAELMSDPPSEGGVTLAGFASLPVIQLLSGDREFDLAPSELRECWVDGAKNAYRVDRTGFERVWKEVQEYFEDDFMGEARKEAKKSAATPKKKRGGSAFKDTPLANTVGAQMSPEDLKAVNEGVKSMSEAEMTNVLDAMDKMDPAAEERMKAMGVDPTMMRQTAKMMKNNPEMMKQAKEMMANMSPEDMLKMSRQAQEQMSKMTPEQREQALRRLQQEGEAPPRLQEK